MSEESILRRLEAQGRRAPRVFLRQEGPSASPLVETCGRYEVLGALAEGGVGEVLRGRDADLGRDVAIKVLRAGHLANPEMLQRFVDEAQIAGQLQHPGVVPVYELGLRADRRPFIAMKLVKGRTLAALLHEGATGRRRLLQVFEQVCRTVAYAHGRSVVHRDLKPSNVMVGAFGEVQILDWGFAKVLARGGVADERRPPDVSRIAIARSGEGSPSVAGSVMGTPAYMPPEQALGHVDELDERSDVFALGAILCEILTGTPPYTGDDLLAKAAQARLEDAQVRLDACEADREMAALARRCLSPLRADRPRDAGEVAEGVGAHLAAVEDRAHAAAVAAAAAEEAAARARRDAQVQRRGRRQTLLLAGAVLVAAVAGTGGYLTVAADRRELGRRAADAVNSALLDVQRLRGEGAWAGAKSAAEKALALAQAGDVAPALRDRARESLAVIASEADDARRQAERRAQADAFVAELEDLLVAGVEGFGRQEENDRRFREVFTGHGIDVDSPQAAERIRGDWSGITEQIAAALDHRAWQRRLELVEWERLVTLAKAIDTDAWRNRLRDAVAELDPETLRALRREVADRNDLPARTLDQLAMALESAGDRDEAIALLRQAWRAHPDDFFVNAHLGMLLRYQKRIDEAMRHQRAAVALRPSSDFAWHELAHGLADRGDLAGAEEVFRRASDLAPTVLRHLECLARVLRGHGEADRAKGVAQEIHDRVAPDSTEAWLKLGSALGRAGLLDGAIEAYREAIRLEPESPFAYANLGLYLQKRGDYADALAALGEAARRSPDHALTRWNLGLTFHLSGDLDSAEREYREAIRLGWSDGQAHTNLGTILALKQDRDGAMAKFRQAIRLHGNLPQPRFNLGITLYESGQRAAALESLRKAKELGQNDPPPDDWIRRTERTIELERKLPEILDGTKSPADAAERATCAWLCYERRLFAESARHYAEAFEAGVPLEGPCPRYMAACSGVLAGGEDWRGRALGWLRADLASWNTWDQNALVRRWQLEFWKRDADLADVRDRIDDLPEAERAEWRGLWADVDATLARAEDGE